MILRLTVIAAVVVALLAAACTGDDDAGQPEYMNKVIPACAPIEGSDADPCEPRQVTQFGLKLGGGGGSGIFDLPEPWDVRWFMDGTSPDRATHMVVRGTFIEDTVRCTSGQVARPPSYGDWGLFPGWESMLKCYADLQVREYLVGAGPTKMTLMVDYQYYGKGPMEIAHRKYFPGSTLEEAEAWYRRVMEKALNGENPPPDSIFNREQIHFIGPAHDDGVEAWERFETWEVERNADDQVIVVHPFRDVIRDGGPDYYTQHRSKLEIPLATFRTQVNNEHQARVLEYGGRTAPSDDPDLASGASAPMLVLDYHNLANHFEQIGANQHALGPPEQPPALCSEGAVPEGDAYGWLTEQCARLLQAKDVLRGSADLNWAANTVMSSWDGITLAAEPAGEEPDMGRRVSGLDLSDEGLDGTIPKALGMIYTLTVLKLNENDLTGHIPTELTNLTNLTELKLSGNNLSGCVPASLRDIASNDLHDLGLADCFPVPGSREIGSDEVRFTSSMYAFSVPEDSQTGAAVGSVLADPGRRGVTYSIAAGNDSSVFTIGSETGAITVAAVLDYETTATHTLTVQAAAASETSTTTVTVNVTDVVEDAPPAPSGLGASLAEGTFTVSWTALDGAAKYEAQHTTDTADSETVTWTALPETTGVSVTYAPVGGPDCSTGYRFRVRAFGDGSAYLEEWGGESDPESVETATCDPEFGQEQYVFYLDDSSAVNSAVGSVSATDPDEGDTLTYSITAGNDDGKFAMDASGNITLADSVDLAVKSFHVLAVEASDGNGGTDTAQVEVGLTITECSNGTAFANPPAQPWLVRDCSVLLTAKDTLRGTAPLNWSADLSIGGWTGIVLGSVVNADGQGGLTYYVRDVMPAGIGLNGSIPSALAGLRDLRRLDLDSQQLSGSIPSELGLLEHLEQLHLFDNRLLGSIPAELGNLARLEILSLYDNGLSGAIPVELGRLGELRQLLLDNNDFTGQLPSALQDIAGLERLFVRDNRLTGSIPAWLASLDELEHLFLEGNSFTGCIPAGLRDVANNDLDTTGLPECGT